MTQRNTGAKSQTNQTPLNLDLTHLPDRILNYREKWLSIVTNTALLDQTKATNAINAFYLALDKKPPTIVFVDGPIAAYQWLLQRNLWNTRSASNNWFEWLKVVVRVLIKRFSDLLVNTLLVSLGIYLLLVIFLGLRYPNLEEVPTQFGWLATLAKYLQALQQRGVETDIISTLLLLHAIAGVAAWFLLDQLERLLAGTPFTAVNQQLSDRASDHVRTRLKRTIHTPWAQALDQLGQMTTGSRSQFSEELFRAVRGRQASGSIQKKGGTFPMLGVWVDPLKDYPTMVWLDVCASELQCPYPQRQWDALKAFVQECGWAYLENHWCVVYGRPLTVSVNSNLRLDAVGKPAIAFADGFKRYAQGGVLLPEKYGARLPSEWDAAWLLDEPNAELRRLICQNIGYTKLCETLNAQELDAWREYHLLKIELNATQEPYLILKMTCPSTNHIHTVRVPPSMARARDAIRWINQGIDPEDFGVEA
ncbi:MAG: hypothetical protein HC879_01515 [Leptolyngbyaceae cyanobacterium SL_5_9]|nr:hypothetical protein [Leptolyngbyaceae cyanobacterium SL_5_9]